MIEPQLSGDFSMPDANGDHALMFARAWAERLDAELPSALDAVSAFALKIRQAEYGEDWSPNDREIDAAFRRMWTANVTLVWTAFQVERWTARLAAEADEEVPAPVQYLQDLRNALEHLDEAAFVDGDAVVPGVERKRKGWSLAKLPRERLPIASWRPGGNLFGLLDVDAIRTLATGLTGRLDALMDQLVEDYMVQAKMDELRGK